MSVQPGRRGLLGHDLSGAPPEEVRFGVVLNGGVSLAVWMGGVALELDRLVKAPARADEPYAALLRLTCRPEIVGMEHVPARAPSSWPPTTCPSSTR